MDDSPQDVYARYLPTRYGYPLWNPEPNGDLPYDHREDGFQIGDVGIVDPDCGFDVLFNVCKSYDHPLHKRDGVPQSQAHCYIVLANEDVHVKPDAICPGFVMFSSGVEQSLDYDPLSRYVFSII